MPQDYYFRFHSDVIGQENIERFTSDIGRAALQVKILNVAAKEHNITLAQLRNQLGINAKAEEVATQETDRRTAALTRATVAVKAHTIEVEKATVAGSLFGRIGGRVAGAELGRLADIPGGGFIGSQIAYSSGITGQSALALGAGALGLYAGFEVAKAISDTTKWAQEQRNLGREFGISAGEMATFSRASEVLGVNLQGSIRQVSNLGSELEKGGSRYKEVSVALSELGLKPETAFKPAAEAINDIVAALSKIPDDGDRARKAVDLLGESGRNLAVAVKEIPDLRDKLTIGDDAVDRVARLRDVLAEIDVKGGLVEALSVLFQGVLPDRSQAGGSKLAIPPSRGVRPLDTTYGITLGSGQFGELQSPAQIKAGRAGFAAQYEATHGTPEDKYQASLAQIDIDKRGIERQFREDFTLDQGGYERGLAGIEARKSAALALKKAEEEAIRKQKEYADLIAKPLESNRDAINLVIRLRKDFPGFPVPAGVIQRAIAGAQEQGAGALARPEETYQTPAQVESEFQRLNRERFGGARTAQQERDQLEAAAVGGVTGDIRVAESQQRAAAAQRIAIATGQSRYGMTPAQLARLELSQGLGAIGEQYNPQIAALQGQAHVATAGAQAPGISSDQRLKFEQEARDADIEAEIKKTEALTRAIEVVNKFNDSVDKAAEGIRNEFAGGFESILLGAQRGALRGQAGTGALDALRGFGEKLEGTVLHNIGARIYGDPNSGAGGVLQKIGGVLPPWLTQGTILGQVDKKLDPSSVAITDNATKNADRIVAAIRGTGVGGNGIGGGVGFPAEDPNAWMRGGDAGGSIPGEIAGVTNTVTGITAAVRSGSPAAILSALSTSFAKIGKGLGQGIGEAGDITAITNQYEGETRTEQVGAIIGTAGIAAGVADGIRRAASGSGVRSVSGGIAESLGAASVIPGPQQPFVAAAAGVASLVSAFSPDPKTQRANQIAKAIFTSQYLAPPSENIGESGSGGYADLDIYGGVRNSRFSPYPIVSDSYLDIPRRTVVPGGVISSFGGAGGPLPGSGAQRPSVPTPITIQVSTMDSKSFNDNASKIVDAAHLALQSGYHPLLGVIRSQLGLNS